MTLFHLGGNLSEDLSLLAAVGESIIRIYMGDINPSCCYHEV